MVPVDGATSSRSRLRCERSTTRPFSKGRFAALQKLADEALARGRTVHAAVRQPQPGLPAAVRVFAPGSPQGAVDWPAALDGVDAVVHLAARVHVMHESHGDPLGEFRRVNVDATAALAEAAARAGVRRLVFASSVKVLGEATEEVVP